VKKHWFVVLALLVSASLSAQPQASSGADGEKQIRAALARWVEAANRQDWKAALDVWAPDLIGWYPGEPDDTYQQEAEFAAHPKPRSETYQVTVNEVIVSGPLAVVRDTWVITDKLPSGQSKAVTLRSYEIWHRQSDSRWKIIRWISSPEPAKAK
jgi:ketosteroid isomerase-like protein